MLWVSRALTLAVNGVLNKVIASQISETPREKIQSNSLKIYFKVIKDMCLTLFTGEESFNSNQS